jgi:hypothetical protein
MKKLIEILIVLAMVFTSSLGLCKASDPRLDEAINGIVSLIKDSNAGEYTTDRIIVPFDFSSATGAVVVFSMGNYGSGNNWCQFMAIFADLNKDEIKKNGKHYTLIDFVMVGGKSWRKIKSIDVKQPKASSNLIITVHAMDNEANEGANVFTVPVTIGYDVLPEVGHRIRKASEKMCKKGKVQPLYHIE